VLDQPEFDVARALEAHRRALQARLGRLRRLITTVDRTIAYLKGDDDMNAKELFAGFSDGQQAEHEKDAEARWGESVRESSRKWKAYPPAHKAQIMVEGQVVTQDLMDQLDQPPASPAVQTNIARWHRHLCYFFEPSAEVLRGLGNLYNDDPQFNATYQKLDPRLAPFMRSAIEVYCERLGTGA
jgi:hypothetical protein